jgi:hypothetical protein
MKYLRTPLEGESVHVYRNLHKQCWSVRAKGNVIAHVDAIQLLGCTCHVSEAGRKTVIATNCRSVHAYVKGTITHSPISDTADSIVTMVYLSYMSGKLFDPVTNVSIESAERMVFSKARKVYCHGFIS